MSMPPERASASSESRRNVLAAYGMALALAVALIVYLYPLSFLAGHSAHFSIGDVPQHVAGWLLYAQDGWHFPLLKTTRIAPPEGVSIVVTDSIPLAALIFKPFAGMLPEGFHYFGLWHVVLRVSQAVAAVYLVRSLGATSVAAAGGAAAIALLWPAALARIDHTALGTHAVILGALAFYFRALRDGWGTWRLAVAWGSLCILSLLIHPYLAAMVLAIFVACLCDVARRQASLLRPLTAAVCVGAGLLAVTVTGGYFGGGSVSLARGHFSMNLLAPVCGGGLTLCPAFDATGGQQEGYNYLGFGAFILLAAGLWAGRARLAGALRRHAGLAAVLVLLTVYAVSTHVYLGDRKLFEYVLPFGLDAVGDMFRATGRFFWPVGYTLFFGALALFLARDARWKVAVLVLAVSLQAVDAQPIMERLRERSFAADFHDFAPWARFPEIGFVAVYPAYGCGEVETAKYVYFERVAARLDVAVNTAYVARRNPVCATAEAAPVTLEAGRLSVYLYPADRPRSLPPAFRAARDAGDCAEFPAWGGDLLCYPGASAENWAALALGLAPIGR